MNYWLLKSEPDTFSIDDLKKNKREVWSGVRNYQARNTIRDLMRVGEICFFYHSSCAVPAIVGLCKIVSEPYPDPTQFEKSPQPLFTKEGRSAKELEAYKKLWFCVDVEFVVKFEKIITLSEIKEIVETNNKNNRKEKSILKDLKLIQKGSRLSVQPVTAEQANFILCYNRTNNGT